MKRFFMCAMTIAFTASMAFAAGQTEVSNVTQEFNMKDNASITATPNSAGGGLGFGGFNASGGAEYMGTVEVNTIEAAAGSKVKNVNQSLNMSKNSKVEGSSVKINTVKTKD